MHEKKMNMGELITYLLLVGYTLFIGIGIFLATKASGVDVYGTQISYSNRVMDFIKLIPIWGKNLFINILFLILITVKVTQNHFKTLKSKQTL